MSKLNTVKKLTRGALLIALALVLQGLRMVIPIPGPTIVSTAIIGSLVHMMLALTLWMNGRMTALLLSFLLPITAYMQGQLLLPILIPIVWVGNAAFVLLLGWSRGHQKLSIIAVPSAKAAIMAYETWFALNHVLSAGQLSSQVVGNGIMFGMSVMQFVTGVAGLLLARYVYKKM